MKVQKAGTILLNFETKNVGLVYRKSKDDYSFPKGHLEQGESLQECAVRETEEETLRANHLLTEKEIEILSYLTPTGEDVNNYMYLAVDDGPTTKEIAMKDRESLRWFNVEEVEKMLSYTDLKEFWKRALPSVLKLFSQN